MAKNKIIYEISKKLTNNFLDEMIQDNTTGISSINKKNMTKIASNPDFNPTIFNGDSVSILSQCAIQGNLHAVTLLCQNILTNLNAIHTGTGKTAISFGARDNRIDCSLYLLKRHADPSIADNKGENTLHHAVCNISTNKPDLGIFIAELLKHKKLDPLARNNDGFNAYQLTKDPYIRNVLLKDHRIKKWFDKATHKDAYIKKERIEQITRVFHLPEPCSAEEAIRAAKKSYFEEEGSAKTALHYAVKGSHSDVVERIINNKLSNDFNFSAYTDNSKSDKVIKHLKRNGFKR